MKKLILLLVFILFGCRNIVPIPPIVLYTPIEMTVTDDIILGWDHSGNATKYKLYYRQHETSKWLELGETIFKTFVIDKDLLSIGDYDFGVSSIYVDEESEIHSSLDESAEHSGWYLEYRK